MNTDEPTIPNTLIDRERIRGETRVIREGVKADEVTAEQIAAVISDVEIFRRQFKIDRKQIAQAISYAESVVSEVLTGKYAGNVAHVAIDLEDWLTEEWHRRKRPETTAFTWTNVAQLIKATSSYCLDHKTIGLVYSPDCAGVGKTITLRAIHQLLGPRRSTLVTINKTDGNPTGLLVAISKAMHVDPTGSSRQRFTRIVDKLKGRSHLLMVDQIHNLMGATDDKPLFILCDIFDETNSAQLWAGTNDLIAYLNRRRVKALDESLCQIRRRVFPCIDLVTALRGSDGGGDQLFTIEQIREIFGKGKMRIASDASRFLCKLANLPDSGSIGLCVQLIQWATMAAEVSGKSVIDLAMLRAGLRQCFTVDRAEQIIHQAEDAQTAPAMAKVG